MNQRSEEIVSIRVMPDIRMLPVIQKVTQEICGQLGLSREGALKTALAVEEVFSYCLKLVLRESKPSRITLTCRREEASLLVMIDHQGPRGELEKHFQPGREGAFPLTSFDAIGLKIARDIRDDLRYVQLFDGTSRFTISVNLPPEEPSGGGRGK